LIGVFKWKQATIGLSDNQINRLFIVY